MPTTRKPRAKKPTAAEELAAAPDVEILDPLPTEDVAAPAPDAPQEPNGVVVIKVVDEQGNISTDVHPIGNVLATEVQTLLELGIPGWRAKIGLDKAT